MAIRLLAIAKELRSSMGAFSLICALLLSSPAAALDRWFEAGCFHVVDVPGAESRLTEADEACREASNEAYGSQTPSDGELARACANAKDMWVRSEYAMALITRGAWADASEILENALEARAAPFLVNMLNGIHDGDWIAARARVNPSAACMAGVRLEIMLRDPNNEQPAIAQAIREQALQRYRLAAESGLSFAKERLHDLGKGSGRE